MKKYKKYSENDLILIQAFVNNIDEDIEINNSENKRYECDPEMKEIYLGNKNNENLDIAFENWYKKQPEYTPINIVLISILHEIGHCMTFDDKRNKQRDNIENMLVFMYQEGVITEEELNNSYFSIECERLATMWGVQYYKNNKQKCEELAAALGI